MAGPKELLSGQLDPDRSSPFHKAANRIVYKHEMKLAKNYEKLGDIQLAKGDRDAAYEDYWESHNIEEWLDAKS